jgi:hypothetical protein
MLAPLPSTVLALELPTYIYFVLFTDAQVRKELGKHPTCLEKDVHALFPDSVFMWDSRKSKWRY